MMHTLKPFPKFVPLCLLVLVLMVSACDTQDTTPPVQEHVTVQGQLVLPASFLPEGVTYSDLFAATIVWLYSPSGEPLKRAELTNDGAFTMDEVPTLTSGQRLMAVTGSGDTTFVMSADLGALIPENGTVNLNITLESSLLAEVAHDPQRRAEHEVAANAIIAASYPDGVEPVDPSVLMAGDLVFAVSDESSASAGSVTTSALATASTHCTNWWLPTTPLKRECVPDLHVVTYEPDAFRVLSRSSFSIPGLAIAAKLTESERRVAMRQDPYASAFNTIKLTFFSNGEIRTVYSGLRSTSATAGQPGNIVVSGGNVMDERDQVTPGTYAAPGYQLRIGEEAVLYVPGPDGYTGNFAIFSARLLDLYTPDSLAAYAQGLLTTDQLVRRVAHDLIDEPGDIPNRVGEAADSGADDTPPPVLPPLGPQNPYTKPSVIRTQVLSRPTVDSDGEIEILVWNAGSDLQAFWDGQQFFAATPLTHVGQRDGATVFRTIIPRWLNGAAEGRFYLAATEDNRNRSGVHTVQFPNLPSFTLTSITGTEKGSSVFDGGHYVISGEVLIKGRVQAGSAYNPVSRFTLYEFFYSLGAAEVYSQTLSPSVSDTQEIQVRIDTQRLLMGQPLANGYHYFVMHVVDQSGGVGAYGPVEVLVQNEETQLPPEPLPVSGVANNWGGGSGTVDAITWAIIDGGMSGLVVNQKGTGTINHDGSFSITLDLLNRSGDQPYLRLIEFGACEGVTVTPDDATFAPVDPFEVKREGELLGRLVLASSLEVAERGMQGGADYQVSFFYVPQAVTVEGTCENGSTTTYALDLKPGWNPVVMNGSSTSRSYRTGTLPLGLKWYFWPRY